MTPRPYWLPAVTQPIGLHAVNGQILIDCMRFVTATLKIRLHSEKVEEVCICGRPQASDIPEHILDIADRPHDEQMSRNVFSLPQNGLFRVFAY